MSSSGWTAERKRELRQRREWREREALRAERRRRRRVELGAVAAAALAVLAIAVVVSQLGSGDERSARGSLSADARTVQRELAGIPQHGSTLGRPRAPVRLIEFADLQCPFCAQYTRDALAGVIDRYVRPGYVQMELRLLSFIGPDSERGARVADAAALQDRLWSFSDLFFRHQGAENSGYVTNAFLQRLAHATPGLAAQRALSQAGSPRVGKLLAQAQSEASRLGVTSTPSFYFVRAGQTPERLDVSALTTGGLFSAIDGALDG